MSPAPVSVRITGDKELQRMFTILPQSVRNTIALPELVLEARLLSGVSKRMAPVLDDVRTLGSTSGGRVPGTLQRGIYASKGFSKPGFVAVSTVAFPTRAQLGIGSSERYFWPAAVHYGHTVVQRKTGYKALLSESTKKKGFRKAKLASRGMKKRVKARPFLGDAFKTRKAAIKEALPRRMAKRVEEEARRLGSAHGSYQQWSNSSTGYALGVGGGVRSSMSAGGGGGGGGGA